MAEQFIHGPIKWHPKFTPYRLLVLATTIGVGTAKAILSQNGKSVASNTLEWISGVLIFLVLYFMSAYDESPTKDPPAFLKWLFRVDCMDYVWQSLSFLSISRPPYSSDPRPTQRSARSSDDPGTSSQTPLTLYRFMVCITTACFGLTKAALTYFGYPAAANWIDWTLGVIITTGLYTFGLYENNPVGTWSTFFVTNHSAVGVLGLYYIACGAFMLFLLLFFILNVGSLAWLSLSFWIDTKKPAPGMYFPIANDSAELTTLGVLQGRLLNACAGLCTPLFSLILVFAICLGYIEMAKDSGLLSLPSCVALVGWVGRHTPRFNQFLTFDPQSPRTFIRRATAIHSILHLTFLTGCGVYLALWVVSVACSIEDAAWLLTSQRSVWAKIGLIVVIIGVTLFQLSCAGACMLLMWNIGRYSSFPPLLQYWNGNTVSWFQSFHAAYSWFDPREGGAQAGREPLLTG